MLGGSIAVLRGVKSGLGDMSGGKEPYIRYLFCPRRPSGQLHIEFSSAGLRGWACTTADGAVLLEPLPPHGVYERFRRQGLVWRHAPMVSALLRAGASVARSDAQYGGSVNKIQYENVLSATPLLLSQTFSS